METNINNIFQSIEDQPLLDALNALGRSVNIVTTYGIQHPAAEQAVKATTKAFKNLFIHKKKVIIGAFNGALTVNDMAVRADGTSLKSIERRLVRLRITGLRIARGISDQELLKLIGLLSYKEAADFQKGIHQASLPNITTEGTVFKAVHEGEIVANASQIAGLGGNGILNLEDESPDTTKGNSSAEQNNIHVNQIVAFFKGDINMEAADVSEELSELASDPARLGQLVMESVKIRQSVTEFSSGESLGDIVLGCLRRTYDGLHQQPSIGCSTEGKANLQKSLLLLEESMLDKIRELTGDPDPELDRKIVQAIRAMDETLSFEIAAQEYVKNRDALEQNKKSMQDFTHNNGQDAADELISKTELSLREWHKIIIEGKIPPKKTGQPPVTAGTNNPASVFEKLENLIKPNESNENPVNDLPRKANEKLDETIITPEKKLDLLSQQINEATAKSTIGGQGRTMARNDLLTALSEVAQELMQPVTAINASIEMMLQGYVGDITAEQDDMLRLASNSGEHLHFLMNELIAIVGCPANTGVDDRFHTTSEQVAKMQDTEGQAQLFPRYFQ